MTDFEHLPNNPDLLLSYSRLSEVDRTGPRALIRPRVIDNQGVTLGSLVDDLLFNEENVENEYLFTDITEPTASLKKLTDIILTNYAELPTLEKVDEIVELNELWRSTKKLETRRKNYDIDAFWEYLNIKYNHSDKKVIDNDTKLLAEELVFILKNYEYSKPYFEEDDNIEVLSQYVFKTEHPEYIMRGIYDMIIIDHQNKTIKAVDLKTGKKPLNEFEESFIHWRYYIQASIYQETLKHLLQHDFKQYEDYQILDFEFLYIGIKEKIPAVFKIGNIWQNAAKNGFFTASGQYYKGVDELISDCIYHWSNNKFDLPVEFYKNNGVVTLSSNGIILKDE